MADIVVQTIYNRKPQTLCCLGLEGLSVYRALCESVTVAVTVVNVWPSVFPVDQ